MAQIMPVLFLGHGSPMVAIEDSSYRDKWIELGQRLPKPKAILCISAHWYIRETAVNDQPQPEQIYDFYGFPKELYELRYRPFGAPSVSWKVKSLLSASTDNTWGIDHGAWSVLSNMYPQADIPVAMLSIDQRLSYEGHYELGKRLRSLREEGVLILASGNIVHNLRRLDWSKPEAAFGWAEEFDDYIEDAILHHNHDKILHHPMTPAVPSPDHFLPLLYALGASNILDQIEVVNKGYTYGSISMTGYLFYRK